MESALYDDELIGTPSQRSEYTIEMMLAELLAANDQDEESSPEPHAEEPVFYVKPDVGEMSLDDDLGLPLRWANCFRGGGIYTVADIVGKGEKDLLCISGIGGQAISLLESALSTHGLPALDAFPNARLSVEYKLRDYGDGPAVQPAQDTIVIKPFESWDNSIPVRFESVSLFEILPQGSQSTRTICYTENVTLSELHTLYECIPSRLREVIYFEDEPLDNLLSHSLDYCLLDFGYEEARSFYKELIALLSTSASFVDSAQSFVRAVRTNMPKVLLPVRVGSFHIPKRAAIPCHVTIEELLSDDSDILSAYVAYSIARSIKGLFLDYQAPIALDKLFEESIRDAGIRCSQRNLGIISKSLGIGLDPTKLEPIASEYGLSRQRIQQVVKRFRESYDITKSFRMLPLRLGILAEAIRLGCVGSIVELEKALSEGRVTTEGQKIMGVLALLPEFEIDAKEGTFRISDYPCPTCNNAKRVMETVAQERVVVSIEAFMQSIGCNRCPYHLSPKFESLPLDPRLLATESVVGHRDDPKLAVAHNPRSVRARIHSILVSSERALNANEIAAEYEKNFGEEVTKPRLMSHLGNYDDVILWGRGTYIHIDYAPFPEGLVSTVAKECQRLFRRNRTPILGIGAIYQRFKRELTRQEVPTEHALYSLLRMINYEGLLLKEYPWVCDEKKIRGRTTFAKYFDSVMRSHNGYISDNEANELARRAMTQTFQLSGMQQYKKNLIHADGGTYNLDMIDIDYRAFDEFVRGLAEPMEDGELVSARAVFADNRSRLVAMGIRSYEMLYRILDMREDRLPLNASRLPHLIKSDKARITVKEAMRNYVREAGRSVSIEELREEFVGRRGVARSNIAPFFLLGDGIVKVGENLFAWEETLQDTKPDIHDIEDALDAYCASAVEKARLFYDIDQAIRFAPLPKMSAAQWNRDLLSAVLSESDRYRVMGPERNALVSIDRHPSVNTDEAFFDAILFIEFYGFASWRDFVARVEKLGIATGIKPDYFASMPSIEASEVVIRLRR